MKRFKFGSLPLVCLLASGLGASAVAQSAAAGASGAASTGVTKIAVINFQGAVAQTNEGQRNFSELQKKFDPKRTQLKSLQDKIDSDKKQLQASGDKLSDAERASRAKQIDDKKKQLQRDGEDASNDFQNEMQEMYQGLASKVYDVLSTYAQQHGYTLVLDVAQQQTPVLYAVDSTNITKPIIDAYNVKSGVPAPPAQPAGMAAPTGSTPGAPKPAPRIPPTTH